METIEDLKKIAQHRRTSVCCEDHEGYGSSKNTTIRKGRGIVR